MATVKDKKGELTTVAELIDALKSFPGDMPLEELLGGYQRGAELLQYCRDKLQAVENQINVLDAGTLKTWMPE